MKLTSHEATIMPHPASRDSLRRQMHPTRGGMTRPSATSVLFLGRRRQAATPIHSIAIWTAPEGAVYNMVLKLLYPMFLITSDANCEAQLVTAFSHESSRQPAGQQAEDARRMFGTYRQHRGLHGDENPKSKHEPRLDVQ